eukprot:TRINITY_DN74175_c0_g1_i1.p1 TRINITY_DN74175_c0_g1~~TRINITY_DN74175_c0_g1_i1.p1  ORF type:complete len:462 (-),score=109.23 TRINITY_DN74175_c0_g1_i1:114-1499(-)
MPSFLQTGGSLRQRCKTSDIATQQLAEQRRYRIAEGTRDALDQFEEKLRLEQELFDDLPAEASSYSHTRSRQMMFHGTRRGGDFEDSSLRRSATMPQARQGHLEDPLHSRRPPSPLSMYDYGCISMKPRSLVGQLKHRKGEPLRAKHRSTSCGFYYPGAQMKQGPYGFSLLDPVLLANRPWQTSKSPSLRHTGDAAEMRPLGQEEFGQKRNCIENPVSSPTVRATVGHTKRAQHAFKCLDKRRDEQVLEQARFEHGVFEGRWRDPLLDMPYIAEPPPETHLVWLDLPEEEMTPEQVLAAAMLFRLDGLTKKSRGHLYQLVCDKNGGALGVLEVDEFLKSLVKIGCVEEGELTHDTVIGILSVVDPAFDGRVNVPTLGRAVKAAGVVRSRRERESLQLQKQHQVKMRASYSEKLAIDVVRLEHSFSSLLNFQRSFSKFMAQQKELLEHHTESNPSPIGKGTT